MQSVLKTKSATNAFAENAEIIYQDLLQYLIPIMAVIDVMPRQTNEHALWRSLGGIIDEYAKNPFILEKLTEIGTGSIPFASHSLEVFTQSIIC